MTIDAIPLRRLSTDLGQLLRDAVAPLQQQAAALDISLSVVVADDTPGSVSLDAEKIAWAVTALVGNSMRYVRGGTRTMPGGSIQVDLAFDPERRELLIAVADDGRGIAPDKLARLFERGTGTTHAAGLALLLAQDIVTAHGGTVEVESSTGAFDHGTTVTLRLPAGAA